MKILLDTNALVWVLAHHDGGKLGKDARQALQAAKVVYVSPVSVLELRIKAMLGKLEVGEDLLSDIAASGCDMLEYSGHDADAIRCFPQLARHDPFDRMLLAQAQTQHLTLLTADTALLCLDLPFVMDARR